MVLNPGAGRKGRPWLRITLAPTEEGIMSSTLAKTAGLCFLASVALTAADFWEEKEFSGWSNQQVEKILSDSPWARKVTVLTGRIR